MKTTFRIRWFHVLGLAALGAGVYYLLPRVQERRALRRGPHYRPEIRERLPIAQNLATIPDYAGNYDIDGVSFDTAGVIIASDNVKDMHLPN